MIILRPLDCMFARQPQNIPRGLWEFARPFRAACAICGWLLVLLLGLHIWVGLALLGITAVPVALRQFSTHWLMPTTLIVLLWIVFSSRIATRSFIAKLRASNSLLCTSCAYDLRGSPEEGHCPECGEYFSHSETVRTWGECFGPRP